MMGGEALEQVTQRSCAWPIPGSVQAQVGWNFEQSEPVKDVPVHDMVAETRWSLKAHSNPNHFMSLWNALKLTELFN